MCEDYEFFGENAEDIKRVVLTYDDSDNITKLEWKRNNDEIIEPFNQVDTFSQAIETDILDTFTRAIETKQVIPKEEYCTLCWDKDDVADYDNWGGKTVYTTDEVHGIHPDTPFSLHNNISVFDNGTNICEMQCKAEFWSNARSSYNRLSFGNDQRCTFGACKNWDYDNIRDIGENVWNLCTECWGAGELSYYAGWDGKVGFTEEEVANAHEKEPFTRRYDGDTRGHCELKCKSEFWSNYNSSFNKASDINDQRCTYDNCKNWDYTDTTSDPKPTAKTCNTCWSTDDVASSTWPAKKTYGKNSGWHTTEPF